MEIGARFSLDISLVDEYKESHEQRWHANVYDRLSEALTLAMSLRRFNIRVSLFLLSTPLGLSDKNIIIKGCAIVLCRTYVINGSSLLMQKKWHFPPSRIDYLHRRINYKALILDYECI